MIIIHSRASFKYSIRDPSRHDNYSCKYSFRGPSHLSPILSISKSIIIQKATSLILPLALETNLPYESQVPNDHIFTYPIAYIQIKAKLYHDQILNWLVSPLLTYISEHIRSGASLWHINLWKSQILMFINQYIMLFILK